MRYFDKTYTTVYTSSRLESELAGDRFCESSSWITSVSFSLELVECADPASSFLSWLELFFLLNCQLGMPTDDEGDENCFRFRRIPLIVSISDLKDCIVFWRIFWFVSCICFCLFKSSLTLISSLLIALEVFASSSILSPFFLPNKSGSMNFCLEQIKVHFYSLTQNLKTLPYKICKLRKRFHW